MQTPEQWLDGVVLTCGVLADVVLNVWSPKSREKLLSGKQEKNPAAGVLRTMDTLEELARQQNFFHE